MDVFGWSVVAAVAGAVNAMVAAVRRPSPAASGDLADAVAGSARGLPVEEAVAGLAGLGQLLVSRLTSASGVSADIGDRVSCVQAARHAASICTLRGGVRSVRAS
jgi:hypothetical protein